MASLVDLEETAGFPAPPVIKQVCQKLLSSGKVETLALEYDENFQKVWNQEQLVEGGCDDDVIAGANNDI